MVVTADKLEEAMKENVKEVAKKHNEHNVVILSVINFLLMIVVAVEMFKIMLDLSVEKVDILLFFTSIAVAIVVMRKIIVSTRRYQRA